VRKGEDMMIQAGSSKGALWLYGNIVSRLDKLGEPYEVEAVSRVLNHLCPPGWAFKDNNGQWGLWPDDVMKYTTHALLYSEKCSKMVEVRRNE
jgi:hypothetical protein